MQAGKPTWTSSSFLLYAGGLFVLVAAVEAFIAASRDHGSGGFVGWSVVIFAVLLLVAFAFREVGEWIAAGVFAVSAVVAWAVLIGALESWFGWLPRNYTPFRGFHVGVLAIAALALAAALVALRVFRFPLLVALVAVVIWFFVADLISNGGNWTAVVTLLIGLGFFAAARRNDRRGEGVYGFWLHVAAGLTVGGALVWFWHSSDANFALIAAAGVIYVAIAVPTHRSSYAVLGAYGLYLAAVHFADKWSGNELDSAVGFFFPLTFVFYFFYPFGYYDEGGPTRGHDWAPSLTYAVLGFILVALGLVLAWRGRAETTAAGTT